MAITATSFTDLMTSSGTPDDTVAATALKDLFGGSSNISNVVFNGSTDSAFAVANFTIGGVVSSNGGIFLSSGDLPGTVNTKTNYTVSRGTPGDADLTKVAQDAFGGAGETQDAVTLSFDYFNNDPNVDTLQFSFVFGSDEFPEYADSSFIDVAAVFVNGVNQALFNNAVDQPLSVTDKNLALGNFIDNQNAAYDIEWDGFSTVLTIRAKLVQGVNQIKIGIADTGDTAFDSGLYIGNVKLSNDGATGGGALTVVSVPDGDAEVTSKIAPEEIALGTGAYGIKGTAQNLNGDVITGFGINDSITFTGTTFTKDNVTVSQGSLILDVDTNNDGIADTKVTLAGKYEGQDIVVSTTGGDTKVTLVPGATEGPDKLVGTDGNDVIKGLGGNDNINGGAGNDRIYGGEGNDLLRGAQGNDVVYGNAGNDRIYGSSGNDTFRGGSGNDTLFGDTGNDRIYGDTGDDKIYGGAGKDTLIGGIGRDAFVFNTKPMASNVDRILDFRAKSDEIWLDDDIFKAVGDVGTLDKDAFTIGKKATDDDHRIIYDDATGKIYYDANGSAAGGMVHFVTVSKDLKLSFSDFEVIV